MATEASAIIRRGWARLRNLAPTYHFSSKGTSDFAEAIHDRFGRDLGRIMVLDELLPAR